jgi:D-tyrosyl-tRNA(Tyr) deacylase
VGHHGEYQGKTLYFGKDKKLTTYQDLKPACSMSQARQTRQNQMQVTWKAAMHGPAQSLPSNQVEGGSSSSRSS